MATAAPTEVSNTHQPNWWVFLVGAAMMTAESHTAARTGGYVLFGDDCWSFDRATCTENEQGYLNIEAEGDRCYFDLPHVLDQCRTGLLEEMIGCEQPFYHGQFEPADFIDCGLVVPGRCLLVTDVRATFTGCDPVKSLVFVELTVTAESEEGDFRGEFEIWLACEYDGVLLAKIDEGG